MQLSQQIIPQSSMAEAGNEKDQIQSPAKSNDTVLQESNTEEWDAEGLFGQYDEDFEWNKVEKKSSDNDRSSQNQKLEQDSCKLRKKRKFLQKQEILELRTIFEQHPDPAFQSENSSQNLGKRYNVCRQTISRLRAAFYNDPSLRCFLQKKTKTSATGRLKGSMNQSTKIIRNLIYNQLAHNRYITRKELQQAIISNLATMQEQVKVPTLKTISKVLKSLNIVRKRVRQVPKTRNQPDIIEKRFAFCQQYSLIQKEHADIIFFDSKAFDLTQPSNFAWIERGTDLQYEKPSSKGVKVSLLAALSRSGIIAWQTRVGNYSASQFARVSMKILTIVQHGSKKKDKYLVLNGGKTHFQIALKQIVREQQYKLLILPAYCPQLNAIQSLHPLFCLNKLTIFLIHLNHIEIS